MALNKVKILYTDLKPEINKFFFANGTIIGITYIKVFLIKPVLEEWKPAFRNLERNKCTLVTQDLHTHLCSNLNNNHNVLHFLVECGDLVLNANSMLPS